MDMLLYAILKKYVGDSLIGAGALKGVKGDKGEKGDKGDQGIQGIQGKDGVAVAISYFCDTLEELKSKPLSEDNTPIFGYAKDTSSIYVTINNEPWTFFVRADNLPFATGPQGIQGEKGDKGDPGVYYGNIAPDPSSNYLVWINESKQAPTYFGIENIEGLQQALDKKVPMPKTQGMLIPIALSPSEIEWLPLEETLNGIVCETVNVVVNFSDNKQNKTKIILNDLTASTVASFDWNGSLTLYVQNGHEYFISAAPLAGYDLPKNSLTFVAQATSTRTIQLLYPSLTEAEYGIRFLKTASEPACERISIIDGVTKYGEDTELVAAIGSKTDFPVNSFDDIYPWSGIRIVKDKDNDAELEQVMVKIPKFYVKITTDGAYETWMVSKLPKEGYILPKVFLRKNKTEADYYEIARYKTSNGYESASKAIPDVSQNIGYFRTNSKVLGADWHTSLPAEKFEILEVLISIEFATRNIQSIATGLTSSNYLSSTGATDDLIITTDTLGIKPYSGVVDGTFSYRGIEEPFGNTLEIVDGLIFNNNKIYYCDDWNKWGDTITTDYKLISYSLPVESGFITSLGNDTNYPEIRLPTDVSATGDSDSYYCDYFTAESSDDYNIAMFGGGYSTGLRAGIYHWNCALTKNDKNSDVGSRLARSF